MHSALYSVWSHVLQSAELYGALHSHPHVPSACENARFALPLQCVPLVHSSHPVTVPSALPVGTYPSTHALQSCAPSNGCGHDPQCAPSQLWRHAHSQFVPATIVPWFMQSTAASHGPHAGNSPP